MEDNDDDLELDTDDDEATRVIKRRRVYPCRDYKIHALQLQECLLLCHAVEIQQQRLMFAGHGSQCLCVYGLLCV